MVVDFAQLVAEQAKSCDIEKMKDDFNPFQIAAGLQNNSVYTNTFSKA